MKDIKTRLANMSSDYLPNLQFPEDEIMRESGFTTEGYYFWDETFSHCYGPFKTHDECETAMVNYVIEMTTKGV